MEFNGEKSHIWGKFRYDWNEDCRNCLMAILIECTCLSAVRQNTGIRAMDHMCLLSCCLKRFCGNWVEVLLLKSKINPQHHGKSPSHYVIIWTSYHYDSIISNIHSLSIDFIDFIDFSKHPNHIHTASLGSDMSFAHQFISV